MEKKEAILQGAVTRLRPVLLTALTTILGTLPMAFSQTAGAEMRNPLAITLLGGLDGDDVPDAVRHPGHVQFVRAGIVPKRTNAGSLRRSRTGLPG